VDSGDRKKDTEKITSKMSLSRPPRVSVMALVCVISSTEDI
jgi:hypothetical protein